MELAVKEFDELSVPELYEILKARAEVFIIEQQINYQDMDDVDCRATHCFFQKNGRVIAYLRAFRDLEDSQALRIGRVLTLKHGQGIGRKLMEQSLCALARKFPDTPLTMDAQLHAEGFYQKFGFETVSEPFLEEGIMHVKMRKIKR